MKVAAYQAPLLRSGSVDALGLIQRCVERCQADGISFLCCPEAILGGLADYSDDPRRFAVATGRIDAALAPLASNTVATIVGFTELADDAGLYNSAALLYRGRVAGLYRKRDAAIRRSVYAPGADTPVFHFDGLTFGIIICNDSNFSEPAFSMAAEGATVLFVPTNNGLPHSRAVEDLAVEARKANMARATENNLWIIRADVAGRTTELVSLGSSEIVRPDGTVLVSARPFAEEVLVADIGDGLPPHAVEFQRGGYGL
jgi:predicted amidohydrolase